MFYIKVRRGTVQPWLFNSRFECIIAIALQATLNSDAQCAKKKWQAPPCPRTGTVTTATCPSPACALGPMDSAVLAPGLPTTKQRVPWASKWPCAAHHRIVLRLPTMRKDWPGLASRERHWAALAGSGPSAQCAHANGTRRNTVPRWLAAWRTAGHTGAGLCKRGKERPGEGAHGLGSAAHALSHWPHFHAWARRTVRVRPGLEQRTPWRGQPDEEATMLNLP